MTRDEEMRHQMADEFEKNAIYVVLHYADGSKGLSTQEQLMVAAALRAEPSQAKRSQQYLSEEESLAISIARDQVSGSSIVNPDCCLDYELVRHLLRVIDRSGLWNLK